MPDRPKLPLPSDPARHVLLVQCDALAAQVRALEEVCGLLPNPAHRSRVRHALSAISLTLPELRARIDPGRRS